MLRLVTLCRKVSVGRRAQRWAPRWAVRNLWIVIGRGLSYCEEAGQYCRNEEFRKQLETLKALHPLVAIWGHITCKGRVQGSLDSGLW